MSDVPFAVRAEKAHLYLPKQASKTMRYIETRRTRCGYRTLPSWKRDSGPVDTETTSSTEEPLSVDTYVNSSPLSTQSTSSLPHCCWPDEISSLNVVDMTD